MRQHSKSSLFLMELIIAILFFGLASALCIQMFVKAKVMNDSSSLESQAANVASSIAETYRVDQLDDFYQPDENDFVYFDKEWNLTSIKDSALKAKLKILKDTLKITMYNGQEEIFTLDCVTYQQRVLKE